MSNSMESDQARLLVGPDLVPNCLQRLSADGSSRQMSCMVIKTDGRHHRYPQCYVRNDLGIFFIDHI